MKNKISRRKAITTSLKVSLAAMGGYAFKTNGQEYSSVKNSVLKKKLPIFLLPLRHMKGMNLMLLLDIPMMIKK